MSFESGPLSTFLNHPRIRKAAASYVRIRIGSPEADLLCERFGAERYGLLVLDADGRYVESLNTFRMHTKKGAATRVAARLVALRRAPGEGQHRLHVKGGGPRQTFAEALRALDGVRDVRGTDADLHVRGTLPPAAVHALAKRHGVTVRYVDPLPTRAQIEGPGVWYRDAGLSYVALFLLDPKRARLLGKELDPRSFDVPGTDGNVLGHRALQAAKNWPGVLSVFPDLAAGRFHAVGKKGAVNWRGLEAAVYEIVGIGTRLRK